MFFFRDCHLCARAVPFCLEVMKEGHVTKATGVKRRGMEAQRIFCANPMKQNESARVSREITGHTKKSSREVEER